MMYILLHIYIHTLYSLHLYIYICFIYTYCACWCIFIFTATSSAHLNSCWRETIILCCRLNVFWIHSFTGGGASADRSCLVALAECYCESSMPMHNAHTRSYSDSWCVYDILWINRYKYLLYIYIYVDLYRIISPPLDTCFSRFTMHQVVKLDCGHIFHEPRNEAALEIALNFKGKEESLPSIIVFEGGESC